MDATTLAILERARRVKALGSTKPQQENSHQNILGGDQSLVEKSTDAQEQSSVKRMALADLSTPSKLAAPKAVLRGKGVNTPVSKSERCKEDFVDGIFRELRAEALEGSSPIAITPERQGPLSDREYLEIIRRNKSKREVDKEKEVPANLEPRTESTPSDTGCHEFASTESRCRRDVSRVRKPARVRRKDKASRSMFGARTAATASTSITALRAGRRAKNTDSRIRAVRPTVKRGFGFVSHIPPPQARKPVDGTPSVDSLTQPATQKPEQLAFDISLLSDFKLPFSSTGLTPAWAKNKNPNFVFRGSQEAAEDAPVEPAVAASPPPAESPVVELSWELWSPSQAAPVAAKNFPGRLDRISQKLSAGEAFNIVTPPDQWGRAPAQEESTRDEGQDSTSALEKNIAQKLHFHED